MKNHWSVPLKSASVLIARSTPNQSYQLLFIQRPSKGAFANVYAFPGGVYEKNDFNLTSELLGRPSTIEEQLKVTAIRETYEEVGIAIHSGTQNKLNDISSFVQKHAGIQNLMPIIRLITVPFLKNRYDTYFYFFEIDQRHSLNLWDLQHKNTSNGDFSQLITNEKEVVKYEWLSPQEALEKKFNKQIELAPPQMIILNSLSSLITIEQVKSYYKEANCHAPYQISLKINQNLENKGKYPYVALNLYDYDYPVNELIANEKDLELINELKAYKLLSNPYMRNRFYFQDSHEFFNKDFDVDVNIPFRTPFNNLKSYQKLFGSRK